MAERISSNDLLAFIAKRNAARGRPSQYKQATKKFLTDFVNAGVASGAIKLPEPTNQPKV
jgi:hypothetical protein